MSGQEWRTSETSTLTDPEFVAAVALTLGELIFENACVRADN